MFLRLWNEGDTSLEVAAKASAALGAAALGTAFLFDGVYFWRMDARLLGVLVFADHVETAVYCVPLLLMFAMVLLTIPTVALLLRAAHDTIERKLGDKATMIMAAVLSAVMLAAWQYFGNHRVPPTPPETTASRNVLVAYSLPLAPGCS